MIDFYDDPNGDVLKSILSDDQLSELVKEGAILSSDEVSALPDRLFALVMYDGENRIRKYACTDKTNTLVSSIYFLENWRHLPAQAVKTAAVNLAEACGWYDVSVPPQMEKLAVDPLTLGFSAMFARDVAKKGRKKREGYLRQAGLPESAINPDLRRSPYVKVGAHDMTAGDLLDAELASVTPQKAKLASLDDIPRAADIYRRKAASWTPEQRVEFCRPLVARASELGIRDLPEEILQYGNTKTAAPEYTVAMLETRQGYFRETEDFYRYLEKVAEISDDAHGDELAQKLAELDRSYFLDQHWGRQLPDPWLSVYGMYKQAEYVFKDGGIVVTEGDLTRLVSEGRDALLKKFDIELVNALQTDPVAIFDSLPLDLKRVVSQVIKQLQTQK